MGFNHADRLSDRRKEGAAIIIGLLVLSHWLLDLLVHVPDLPISPFQIAAWPWAVEPTLPGPDHRTDAFCRRPVLIHFFHQTRCRKKPMGVMVAGWFPAGHSPHECFGSRPQYHWAYCLGRAFRNGYSYSGLIGQIKTGCPTMTDNPHSSSYIRHTYLYSWIFGWFFFHFIYKSTSMKATKTQWRWLVLWLFACYHAAAEYFVIFNYKPQFFLLLQGLFFASAWLIARMRDTRDWFRLGNHW